MNNTIELRFGIGFEDLYSREGLVKLDGVFLNQLKEHAPALLERLLAARENPPAAHNKAGSELIIELAPHVEDFIGDLFGIDAELSELRNRHTKLAPIYAVKRKFVQRKALTGYTEETASAIDGEAVAAKLAAVMMEPLTELSFATKVEQWLADEANHASQLQCATQYTAWATLSPLGKAKHKSGVLFKTPHKVDPYHLVPVETSQSHGLVRLELGRSHWRHREGFELTDNGTDLTGALDQAHYCIKCHNQAKDSCSTGLKEKNGEYKSSAFGVKLAGCPLDEKISEMNVVKDHGNPIGALAVVAAWMTPRLMVPLVSWPLA